MGYQSTESSQLFLSEIITADELAYMKYVTEWGKSYGTKAEFKFRLDQFKQTMAKMAEHESNSAHGSTVGVNQFSDWTHSEYKKLLGYKHVAKESTATELSIEGLATEVNWVTKGAVTPVKNQGQRGSCWAFSTTGSSEGAYQSATGQLKSFSEQELVDCAGSYGNQGCNGGLMDDGFKYLESKGDALETDYAYTGKTGTCSTTKQAKAALKAGQVTSFNDVTTNSETQMKAAVSQGPVSVAIEADQSGFQFYKTGVFSGTCGTNLDHGVLVVGYGTDSGTAYWKVKNSWGATWGDAGYIKMVKTASGAGICGIAAQASYPVIGGSEDVALSVFRKSLESQFGAWTASAPPPPEDYNVFHG